MLSTHFALTRQMWVSYTLTVRADEGIAPMDDFLKASLPADLTPTLLRHLPELDVSQPDKVNARATPSLV